jgi:transcriptional regulator
MYVPPHFRITDEATISAFLDRELFGIIVTQGDDAPVATHIPMLHDVDGNGRHTLSGHVARANPQWKSFNGSLVLAMFHGPHAYISPSLYDGASNVPTWDYTAVHVYGRAAVVEHEDQSREIVRRLTRRMESTRATAWDVDALPADYLQKMIRAIVAFRIDVERIEAQFKLSQNRSAVERERIIGHLEKSENSGERALAALIPR